MKYNWNEKQCNSEREREKTEEFAFGHITSASACNIQHRMIALIFGVFRFYPRLHFRRWCTQLKQIISLNRHCIVAEKCAEKETKLCHSFRYYTEMTASKWRDTANPWNECAKRHCARRTSAFFISWNPFFGELFFQQLFSFALLFLLLFCVVCWISLASNSIHPFCACIVRSTQKI